MLGLTYVASSLHASNWGLMLRLRLHEEEVRVSQSSATSIQHTDRESCPIQSYADLNPLDRELRRRIFWLHYGGDRSRVAADGVPTLIDEDDCWDVVLPSEVCV